MEKKTFTSFRISRLSNDNVNSLIKSTIDIATPVRAQLGEMANAVLNELIPHASSFSSQINVPLKSKYTEQITNQAKDIDSVLAEIKRTVVYLSKSRMANKKAAAQTLLFFLTPFWGLSQKAIKTKADDLEDMFKKFHADPALVSAAGDTGINPIMTELEAMNEKLASLYLLRNEEIGNRGASGTDLRPAAEEGYVQFCNVVEQSVNYTPNDVLITLFNSMDALRRKYSSLTSDGKDKPDTDEPKE